MAQSTQHLNLLILKFQLWTCLYFQELLRDLIAVLLGMPSMFFILQSVDNFFSCIVVKCAFHDIFQRRIFSPYSSASFVRTFFTVCFSGSFYSVYFNVSFGVYFFTVFFCILLKLVFCWKYLNRLSLWSIFFIVFFGFF